MKINFTKAEYRLLAEMLSVADWVMHSRCNEDEVCYKKYRTLRNKIFSHYKEFEANDIIDAGFENDEYYETDELLNHIHENFMSKFEEEIFWDELIYKLSLRDILSQISVDVFEKMDPMDRISKTEEAKEPYVNEFEKNGLKNVIIKLSTDK